MPLDNRLLVKFTALIFASVLILLASHTGANAQDRTSPNKISPSKTSQGNISKKLKKTPLNEIAFATLQNHFSQHPKRLKEIVESFDITPEYKRAKGVFVTLYKDGKTRACWGNITANHSDLVTNTVFTTEDCLTKEYRYPQVQRKELPELKAQVTVIEKVEPTSPGATLHPLTDGIMVRSGGKGAVLLPGEASDPYYQVMQCKLKAGINPKAPCQIYRIKAHVIR